MSITIIGVSFEDDETLFPAVVAEFDALLLSLDLGTATRGEWERFKAILAQATVEAGDADAGRRGYARVLASWRECAAYDGRD